MKACSICGAALVENTDPRAPYRYRCVTCDGPSSEAHQGYTRWQCRRCNAEGPHFTTILREGNKRVIMRTCMQCRAETAEIQERMQVEQPK